MVWKALLGIGAGLTALGGAFFGGQLAAENGKAVHFNCTKGGEDLEEVVADFDKKEDKKSKKSKKS